MMSNVQQDGSAYEVASLRQELLLRIALQNLLLIMAVLLFGVFVTAALIIPSRAWLCAVAMCCAIFALALQWCHHGIRTCQIKEYLMIADRNVTGWERWLPANRPATLLGTRWLISTKGVFLGLAGAIMCLSAWLDPSPSWPLSAAAIAFWGSTAWFLSTNPKE